ncbi:Hypothetical protein A7982_05902 [Minicystis rosea]|nr:Hypothetical protein A7982_05902 [Minicystis rosea]
MDRGLREHVQAIVRTRPTARDHVCGSPFSPRPNARSLRSAVAPDARTEAAQVSSDRTRARRAHEGRVSARSSSASQWKRAALRASFRP